MCSEPQFSYKEGEKEFYFIQEVLHLDIVSVIHQDKKG